MASRYFINRGLHAEILTRLDTSVDGRVTYRLLVFVGSFSRPPSQILV